MHTSQGFTAFELFQFIRRRPKPATVNIEPIEFGSGCLNSFLNT